MADRVFDRGTVLDIAVNVIPLSMIVFFFVLFVAFDPFDHDTTAVATSLGLLVVPFVVLAAITYVAGRIIAEAEHTGGSKTAAAITTITTSKDATADPDRPENDE